MRLASLGRWLLALSAVGSIAECAPDAPRSVRRVLSLRPGMERTMRVELRERFVAPSQPVPGLRREQHAEFPLLSASMDYRFRVLTVDGSGIAKVQCEALEASVGGFGGRLEALLNSLVGKRTLLYLDRSGRIRAAESDCPSEADPSGLSKAPVTPFPSGPTSAEVESLLSGLNGRVVSVGETWSTRAGEGRGLPGTLLWTVESIRGEEVRLAFRGTIDEQRIPLSSIASGEGALLSGELSGFVVLEGTTGWPIQGKTIVTLEVARTARGGKSGPDGAPLSLTTVTLFSSAAGGSAGGGDRPCPSVGR